MNKVSLNATNLNDTDALLTLQKDYYDRFSSLHLTQKDIRPIGFPMIRKTCIQIKKNCSRNN
jgi:hypothetical protein